MSYELQYGPSWTAVKPGRVTYGERQNNLRACVATVANTSANRSAFTHNTEVKVFLNGDQILYGQVKAPVDEGEFLKVKIVDRAIQLTRDVWERDQGQSDKKVIKYTTSAASTIGGHILSGTGFSLGACPGTTVSIRFEYVTRLQAIAALAKALGLDWWVNDNKMVYIGTNNTARGTIGTCMWAKKEPDDEAKRDQIFLKGVDDNGTAIEVTSPDPPTGTNAAYFTARNPMDATTLQIVADALLAELNQTQKVVKANYAAADGVVGTNVLLRPGNTMNINWGTVSETAIEVIVVELKDEKLTVHCGVYRPEVEELERELGVKIDIQETSSVACFMDCQLQCQTSDQVSTLADEFEGTGVLWNEINGTWAISGGYYKQTNTASAHHKSVLKYCKFADGEVQATCVPKNTSKVCGVIMRKQDGADTYYFAWLNVSTATITLWKMIAGTPAMITSYSDGSILYDTAYRVAMQIQGDAIRVFLNGEKLIDTTDGSITGAGTAGLISYAGEHWFERFAFYPGQFPSGCTETCQTECQLGEQICASTGNCESSCQSTPCQSQDCEAGGICQNDCEAGHRCELTCEFACQAGCQISEACQLACQPVCQTSCQDSGTCQVQCQASVQTCAQSGQCESACQGACQGVGTCEDVCQTDNQMHRILTDYKAVWHCNEESGTDLYDSSKYGNHGSENGPTTIYSAGKFGYGKKYNGSSNWHSIPHSASLNITGTKITIMAWIKTDGGAGSGYIVCKNLDAIGNIQYALLWYATGPVLRFYADGAQRGNDSGTLSTGILYHVAVVYNGTDVRFYVNGELSGTPGAWTSPITSTTHPLCIGRRNAGTYYDGMVDEVCILKAALSAAEIKAIYNASELPIFVCEQACESTCQGTEACETGGICQDACQLGHRCELTCETNCQVACQIDCETTSACETSGVCQGICETGHQCELTCETDCQAGTQICASSGACESSCQSTPCQSQDCEAAGVCQAICEAGHTCETTCQDECQASCQSACQVSCQIACQVSNQICASTGNCENACQQTCQQAKACESGGVCQGICETGHLCQVTAQICDGTHSCQTSGQVGHEGYTAKKISWTKIHDTGMGSEQKVEVGSSWDVIQTALFTPGSDAQALTGVLVRWERGTVGGGYAEVQFALVEGVNTRHTWYAYVSGEHPDGQVYIMLPLLFPGGTYLYVKGRTASGYVYVKAEIEVYQSPEHKHI